MNYYEESSKKACTLYALSRSVGFIDELWLIFLLRPLTLLLLDPVWCGRMREFRLLEVCIWLRDGFETLCTMFPADILFGWSCDDSATPPPFWFFRLWWLLFSLLVEFPWPLIIVTVLWDGFPDVAWSCWRSFWPAPTAAPLLDISCWIVLAF